MRTPRHNRKLQQLPASTDAFVWLRLSGRCAATVFLGGQVKPFPGGRGPLRTTVISCRPGSAVVQLTGMSGKAIGSEDEPGL
jgi:hypothetical protein